MSATLIIPAGAMSDVRASALSRMGIVAQNFWEPVTRPEPHRKPGWWRAGRAELEYLWQLLDILGWRDTPDEWDLELSVAEHGETIYQLTYEQAGLYPIWEEEAKDTDDEDHEIPPTWTKAAIMRRGAGLRSLLAKLGELMPEFEPSPTSVLSSLPL